MKCKFSNCTNEAASPSEYCAEKAPKCRLNHNSQKLQRKRGRLPRAEAIAALAPRECKHCGAEFQPEGFKQEYCKVECRDEIAKVKRREAEPKFDIRESVLSVLDHFTVGGGVGMDINDLKTLRWPTKHEYYATDKRHPWTKYIISEAQAFIEQEGEMSLRSLFYHLVHTKVEGEHNPEKCDGKDCDGCTLLTNTKLDYQKLTRVMTEARERGDIAPDAFNDDARESETYASWDSPASFMQSVVPQYKTNPWDDQERIVEVITEKNTMLAVLKRTVSEYRVPLHVLRGQGSTPYMYKLALGLSDETKPITLLGLYDHDPAGWLIEQSARQRICAFLLEEFSWTVQRVAKQITWKRIGFLHEDFEAFDVEALPEDDKDFGLEDFLAKFPDGKKAELEGLTPTELRRRTKAAIEEAMGPKGLKTYKRSMAQEEKEREELMSGRN